MEYDVTVIGGGPGGYVAAIKAAQYGKHVCLIEQEQLGGVCLNVGCIPTKTLIQSAHVLQTVQRATEFALEGIEPNQVQVNMAKLQARRRSIIRRLTGGVGSLLKKNGVTVVKGTAVFQDANTVVVNGTRITSDHFILATGSHSFTPRTISIAADAAVLTSTEALELEAIPKRLGIIGGGVIGIEFAYLYSALGSQVFVFEAMDQILPMLDETLSDLARKRLEQQGVAFHTGAYVSAIADGRITYQENGSVHQEAADLVLMAVGRVPNSDGLGLETLGVKLERGAVVTDEQLRTHVPNIYAIGDVNAHSMLAHTASREALAAVEHICTGHSEPIQYHIIPSCIYMQPELAAVGLTEKDARAKGLDIQIGLFPLISNGKAMVEGETEGAVKVITDRRTGEIYGVHIMAPHATDLIGELVTAMQLEATSEVMTHIVHPHPTISESISEAFGAALGKAVHL